MTKYQHQNVWLADNHRTEVWPLDSIKKNLVTVFWILSCGLQSIFFSKKDFGVRFWLKLKNLEKENPDERVNKNKYADIFKSGGNILGQSASKH